MANHDLPWVFGLRPHYDYPTWSLAVMNIITGKFVGVGKRDRTIEAEHGLGIVPSWYWYIARSEESYGHSVFFWTPREVGFKPDDRGACPFDTGGLWHGRIVTRPMLRPGGERRSFFENSDRPVGEWRSIFHTYIEDNYEQFSAYVDGLVPRSGVSPILYESPPNSSPAWTWEARLPFESVATYVRIARFYCRVDDFDFLLNWIESSETLDLKEKEEAVVWLQSYSEIVSLAESPALAARRDLIRSYGE